MSEDTLKLSGTITWGDTYQPAVNALVQVLGEGGEPIASSKTDSKGRYEMPPVPAAHACEHPVHLVLSEPEGRILHTTRETPTSVYPGACQLDAIIPGSPPRSAPEPWALAARGAVDLGVQALDNATPETVLAIARSLVSGASATAKSCDGGAEALPALLSRSSVETSLCGTPVLEAIEEVIRSKGWPREVALQVDDILAMRDSDFAPATYNSANFSVTYQTTGPAAVNLSTAAETVLDPGTATVLATIGDGVTPTYVLRVCFWLERALAAYVSAPFSMRNPAAAGRIPVVINTAPYGSASPSGTFYLNNALAADLICAVGVHELFHMVQFQYGGAGPWRQSVFEGGAVFAEDTAADKMNRYLDEAGSNFNGVGTQSNPNLSLQGASYKCCLFWRYVAEQHSPDTTEPFVGVETYRKIIETCAAGGYTTADVRSALRALPWYQDFYEFSYLDAARRDLTNGETTLGNYALACYLKDLGTNVPDRRFDFIEDEENIYIDQVVGGPPSTTLIPPTLSGTGSLLPLNSLAFNGSVNPFASRYYEVRVDPAVSNVQVAYTAGAGLTSCLFQIALIDQDGKVRDIHRTDRTSYSKRVTNLIAGKRLSKVAVVVTGAATGGAFTVNVTPAAQAPNVMVTRWHSSLKKEYEINSRNWAWTWVSPDVWVDNNGDGVADGTVYFNYDNKLHIRLHNKGNAPANKVQIELFYQDASGGLSDAAWKPIKDKAGTAQILSGLSVAAGASGDFVANWSPMPSGKSEHFCVKAVVTVPGDPNSDNKRVLSNFGKVKVKPKEWKDVRILVSRIYPKPVPSAIHVVPRLGKTRELVLSVRDLQHARSGGVLDPQPAIRISHVPITASSEAPASAAAPIRPGIALLPDISKSYETDPSALPPGVAGKPMVTFVEVVDGVARGGVTLLVELER